jgi:hypothetical protein
MLAHRPRRARLVLAHKAPFAVNPMLDARANSAANWIAGEALPSIARRAFTR